jgi:hypothetical protein
MAALYAATHPDATSGLVLFQPHIRTDDFTEAEREALRVRMSRWGTQRLADQLLAAHCPTLLRSESDRIWFANWLRVGASPEIGLALNLAYAESDVRDVLTAVRVPTLVFYRAADAEEHAKAAVALIPGSRLERLGGSDDWGIFLSPEIIDRIEAFGATLDVESEPESVLATVLFTAIAGSSSTRPETAPSHASTALRAQSAARARSVTHWRSWGSRCARDSTPASASSSRGRSQGLRS